MTKHRGKILVVDDNAGIRSALKILLLMRFAEVELIASPKELMAKVSVFRPDVILLDMNFYTDINTGNEGLYWLSEIKANFPAVEVVLFTAYADIALAVEGMKRGAFDFIVKPWENEKLLEVLRKAADAHLEKQKGAPAVQVAKAQPQEIVWGKSEAMVQVKADIEKIAPTDATVLITGENGTGKDVAATMIYRLSERVNKPFVSVDLGAVAETLFESELFGHKKGAFTGAFQDHTGKFEQANGGTLFLDEIGNIPFHLQGKLLRVLQNREVIKVGDTKVVPLDIRLICATNMNLEQMVKEGRFREDLFYRINTVRIELPPLRERLDEIKPLAELYMRIYAEKYRRCVHIITSETLASLKLKYWSGNVRELKNCIEKAVIMSEGEELYIPDWQAQPKEADDDKGRTAELPAEETLEMAEERIIRNAVERFAGNLSLVAKSLNISRPTLYKKLKKYGI